MGWGTAAAIVLLAAFAPAARAASAGQTLADRFAPVVRLVAGNGPCGHGEPYPPENVDAVLGNPSVALRGPWSGANLVKVAPPSCSAPSSGSRSSSSRAPRSTS